MKVKLVIEMLQHLDPESEVVTEFNGGYYPVKSVTEFEFEDGKAVIIR